MDLNKIDMGMDKLINTLNEDQRVIFDQMQISDRLQICLPTGVGKGYLMGVDIKNRFVNGESVIGIASHRLILNTQHLGDIIDRLMDIINDVRFIFVGSQLSFDQLELQENDNIKIPTQTLIKQVSKKSKLNKLVSSNLKRGKKTIIISTYHSLDKLSSLNIDTLYCDEAHTLASNEFNTRFEENFKSLNTKKSYFLTATPKDCSSDREDNDDVTFLMNNENVFGERVGMSIHDAIYKGYITRPVIHMAVPEDYENQDMDNITNKVKFVIDCFNSHTDHVKESSSNPSEIGPKMLIKCESVDVMWEIYYKLLQSDLEDVKLFAGASRKGAGGASYQENGVTLDKQEHLSRLVNLTNTEKAIVLHVDTLSEGVNVKAFTGVMFLTDKTPTIIKLLQNIGRGTRVMDIDRKNFRNGNVNTSDYEGWIKPNTFVILPVYNPESKTSQEVLSTTIKNLRDKVGDSIYKVSIGDDKAKGDDDDLDSMVDGDFKDPRKKLVDAIDHNVEQMYRSVLDDKIGQHQVKLKEEKRWKELSEFINLRKEGKVDLTFFE